MTKKLFILILFSATFFNVDGQDLPEELRNRLVKPINDSSLVSNLEVMIAFYRERNRDSAIFYIKKAISVSEKSNQMLLSIRYKTMYANQLISKQQFAAAYQLLNEIERKIPAIDSQRSTWRISRLPTFAQSKNLAVASLNYNYKILMNQTSNFELVRVYLQKARESAALVTDSNRFVAALNSSLAYLLISLKKPDSAIVVLNSETIKYKSQSYFKMFNNMLMGFAFADLHEYEKSNQFLHLSVKDGDSRNVKTRSALKLSQNYVQLNNIDSALYYANYLLDTLSSFGFSNYEVDLGVAYNNLYQCYIRANKRDSAFKYAQLALRTQDSLMALRIKNLSDFQHLLLSENKRIEAIEDERSEKVARWTNFGAITFSILIGVIALLLFRNVRQSRLANSSLIEQKEKLQKTLDELKSTQSQLIQSEKMASLGELTAGIAHEIQNPLNFVNNFSEVNAELIEEAQREAGSGNQDTLNELLGDIKANSEKITFHGNRADAIVKSMLQHSRKTSAQKELTDINALCDEYLRLAYHGLRAKEKSFNAQFETDFDLSLPKVNVVSQDIGRVILNLINNAFYAVNERYKKEGKEGYVPQVKVSTRQVGDQIEITVTDNGGGIPPNIREKIFQPFFTTKPTGEGTGLGLSMSYDIITKGHGGKMEVVSKEGEGSSFILQIPM
jgi:signal transduction histidine kinase